MIYTISNPASARIKILRSEFVCFLFPVDSVELARDIISAHDKNYASATHNCYAYVIGNNRQIQYYSDAGEPGGTAGKPMLNALLRAELTNVLAIVSRYYGGVKLGVRGLIEAYGEAVTTAIKEARLEEFVELVSLKIGCDYSTMELIRHRANEWKLRLGESEYGAEAELKLSLPKENWDDFRQFLESLSPQKHLTYLEI